MERFQNKDSCCFFLWWNLSPILQFYRCHNLNLEAVSFQIPNWIDMEWKRCKLRKSWYWQKCRCIQYYQSQNRGSLSHNSGIKIQEIMREGHFASISIPKNPSDRKWDGSLLFRWIHLNQSAFCTLQCNEFSNWKTFWVEKESKFVMYKTDKGFYSVGILWGSRQLH